MNQTKIVENKCVLILYSKVKMNVHKYYQIVHQMERNVLRSRVARCILMKVHAIQEMELMDLVYGMRELVVSNNVKKYNKALIKTHAVKLRIAFPMVKSVYSKTNVPSITLK